MWRVAIEVEEARKLPGWADFHRACGRADFFFDHMERQGRRGPWSVDCFTLSATFVYQLLVTGTGKTVIDAIADAHDRCDRATDATRAALAALRDGPLPVSSDDFDSLIGDNFEDLL